MYILFKKLPLSLTLETSPLSSSNLISRKLDTKSSVCSQTSPKLSALKKHSNFRNRWPTAFLRWRETWPLAVNWAGHWQHCPVRVSDSPNVCSPALQKKILGSCYRWPEVRGGNNLDGGLEGHKNNRMSSCVVNETYGADGDLNASCSVRFDRYNEQK